MERLALGAGPRAQYDVDRWQQVVDTHPAHLLRQRRRLGAWCVLVPLSTLLYGEKGY